MVLCLLLVWSRHLAVLGSFGALFPFCFQVDLDQCEPQRTL